MYRLLQHRYSMNSELTESSLLIRSIVSASSSATDSWRIFFDALRVFAQRDGVGHHQLVDHRAFDALHRAARQHRVRAVREHFLGALSLSAPWPPSHSVFAVSTMSSMITQVRPLTSPMMFITVATFGRGRRLSMIARSASSRFASARARTTPPTSGETTTRSW